MGTTAWIASPVETVELLDEILQRNAAQRKNVIDFTA